MKIALVQDELVRRGGGEQVCLSFLKAFPDAPLYTSSYNSELTFKEFKGARIYSSWFGKIANDEKKLRKLFFPFAILAMRSLDLREYDVVLIGGTNSGKYVRFAKNALIIHYCYTPFRLAWNPISYSEYVNSKGIKKIIFDFVIGILKTLDEYHARRIDYFLAMTEETKGRIQKTYNPKNAIEIIPPSVKVSNFKVSENIEDYYLVVSRLEYYKRVDLVIDAFNSIGKRLIVVGKGALEEELKKQAKVNIEFRSGVSNEELAYLYANCKAFIFPQHEDYGITPLEANSAGRPVIAYRKGGVLTTQIDFEINNVDGTALFYDEQTVPSLVEAIGKFENVLHLFDPNRIRKNTERFSEEKFIAQIKEFVQQKYEEHRSKVRNLTI